MNKPVNYEELVKNLAENQTKIRYSGLEITVKPIPDVTRLGEIDPRERAIIKEQFKPDNLPEFPTDDTIDFSKIDIQAIRKQMGFKNVDVTKTNVTIEQKEITGGNGPIPLRIYRPEVPTDHMPAIIYFHGGAFMGGTLDVVENACKLFAEKGQSLVVSVDYRLAPEYRFPQGLGDCFDAIKYVYTNAQELNINPKKIVVTGDSAGGNYAAVCAILDRNEGTQMIAYQVPIYASVNMGELTTPDYQFTMDAYQMSEKDADLIKMGIEVLASQLPLVREFYLESKDQVTHPLAAPLFANDLRGVAPALIVTAEFDKFRLEDEAYARKLIRAGVPVEVLEYKGLGHGFIDKTGIYPQVEDCIVEITKRMKQVFEDQVE